MVPNISGMHRWRKRWEFINSRISNSVHALAEQVYELPIDNDLDSWLTKTTAQDFDDELDVYLKNDNATYRLSNYRENAKPKRGVGGSDTKTTISREGAEDPLSEKSKKHGKKRLKKLFKNVSTFLIL